MCKVSFCKILHVIDEITKKNNEKKKKQNKNNLYLMKFKTSFVCKSDKMTSWLDFESMCFLSFS